MNIMNEDAIIKRGAVHACNVVAYIFFGIIIF